MRALVLAASTLVICTVSCMPGGTTTGGDATLGERHNYAGLSFQEPASWEKVQPSTNMRLAQYKIAPVGADTDAGECAVFHFAGQGGSVEANIERWYGQFQQPDGSRTSDHATRETFTVNGLEVTYLEAAGTYTAAMGPEATGSPKPGYRMAAGVVQTDDGPWFIKCTGPDATISSAVQGLKALLKTVQK